MYATSSTVRPDASTSTRSRLGSRSRYSRRSTAEMVTNRPSSIVIADNAKSSGRTSGRRASRRSATPATASCVRSVAGSCQSSTRASPPLYRKTCCFDYCSTSSRNATMARISDRYAPVIGQADRQFVLQLETYIDALDSERRVRRILAKLCEEAENALTSFAQSDRDLVAELVSIRNRLAADAPDIDVAADPPEPRDPLRRREWIMETLSGFDLVAAGDDEIGFSPMPYYSTANPGRTQQLVQILRGRVHVAEWGAQFGRGPQPAQKLRDDLAHYGIEIENVQARYAAVKRRFKQQELMLPGLADERLRLFVKSLNPEPFLIDPNEDEDVFMERAFRHV